MAAAGFAATIGAALLGCASTPGRKEALDPVNAVAFSADGRTLAASTVTEEVALFDIAPLRFRSLLTVEGAKTKPDASDLSNIFRSPPVAFAPDGKLVVAAGVGGDIVGWDVGSGVVRFRAAAQGRIVDIAFFPDGQSFLTVGAKLKRFNAETGAVIDEMKPPGDATITAVAVSPDGNSVRAGLSTGEIAEYDAAGNRVLRMFKGHAVAVTGVAFSPDGSTFASTAGRFDPRLWSAKDDSPLSTRVPELGAVGESLDKSARAASGLMFWATSRWCLR